MDCVASDVVCAIVEGARSLWSIGGLKVIEVIAHSEKSIDEAIRNAISEASKTIRNIDSVYVKDIKAHVKDGKVNTFGVICKISFRLD